jgi:hypothetical protein
MPITVLAHQEVKPTSLKFPPKWKALLDADHVNHLAIQIVAGQRLPVTVNAEMWVLKGRHSAAAYLKVQKGDPDLGIAAQPKIKVPVERVSGTPQEEKILELSSIVNQRSAKPEEAGPALKEMVELLEQQHRTRSEPVKHQEVVEEVAKVAGKSARTVAKQLRDATPEEERKPSKPRVKKNKIVDEDGNDIPLDEHGATVPPPVAAEPPHKMALRHLGYCLELLETLRKAQANAMNSLHEVADVDTGEATDQLQKDQATLQEMTEDYQRYVHQFTIPF